MKILNNIGDNYGLFTLVTFDNETVGDMTALVTLGDMMAKVSIYSTISWA
jgi:hypothetical protein